MLYDWVFRQGVINSEEIDRGYKMKSYIPGLYQAWGTVESNTPEMKWFHESHTPKVAFLASVIGLFQFHKVS